MVRAGKKKANVPRCRIDKPKLSGCTVRQYARLVVMARWHSEAEWQASVAIITPESHFDPCARYPSTHECSYDGENSCGVPQKKPCPELWRGRLWETRYAQCRRFVEYVADRYGTPSRALSFRRSNNWY